MSAGGGDFSVTVTAPSGCSWEAKSNAEFASLMSGSTGTGNGTVQLRVAANAATVRTGTVLIAGVTVAITQQGLCTYALDPTSASVPVAGGDGVLHIETTSSCSWAATTTDNFLSVIGTAQSSGRGDIVVRVAPNTGEARTGTVRVADQTFTVTQAGVQCTFGVSPLSTTVSGVGGTVRIDVSTGSACAWSVGTTSGFLTIQGESARVGSGSVQVVAGVNEASVRTGIVTVAGKVVEIVQPAKPCSYTFSPASVAALGVGETVTTTVVTDSTCPWSATTGSTFVHVLSGPGTGTGLLRLLVDTNPDASSRSATVAVADQRLTITQASNPDCRIFSLTTEVLIGAAGGTASLSVFAMPSSCGWDVTVPSFVTLISAPRGVGSGSVTVSVAANPGTTQRTGLIRIGNLTVRITQAP